jgi:hypothetical protein
MTQNRLVADIRRHKGGSNFIIELVRRFCSENGATEVEWLVRPDQAHLLPPAEIAGEGEPAEIDWTPRIRDRVIGYSQSDPAGGSLWVLSYDNQLLMVIGGLITAYKHVRVKHLAELISAASIQRRAQRTLPFPLPASDSSRAQQAPESTALPLADGIELAKSILRQGGYTSRDLALPQKDLRLKMETVDRRARKLFGDSQSISLITDIVNDGLQKGWIQRFRRVPEKSGTEQIYFGASQPVVVASAPVLPAPSAPAPATVPPAPVEDQKHKFPTRATEFENHLRKSLIGCIPETREVIFDALESTLAETGEQPMILLDAFAEAVRRAQAIADEKGYTAEKNWPVAIKCVLRLMLWSGVLLSESGAVIAEKIGYNSTRIAKLAPDFRRTCEGFLVLHIIRQSEMISYSDDPYYLGMTLYRRGLGKAVSSDELKIKADQILTYLYDLGTIEMDGDRQIRVCKQSKGAAT